MGLAWPPFQVIWGLSKPYAACKRLILPHAKGGWLVSGAAFCPARLKIAAEGFYPARLLVTLINTTPCLGTIA
jgi:hypothetical protein